MYKHEFNNYNVVEERISTTNRFCFHQVCDLVVLDHTGSFEEKISAFSTTFAAVQLVLATLLASEPAIFISTLLCNMTYPADVRPFVSFLHALEQYFNWITKTRKLYECFSKVLPN